MGSLRSYICFLIFLCLSIFVPSPYHGANSICLSQNQAALFIFGDSLFDSGNNNYIQTVPEGQANYSPYGETFFKYPTGRFSDGRVIPDFIAEYANLPLIQPYLHPAYHQYLYGANFASAGAGALVETYQGLVIDLKTQLSHYGDFVRLLRKKLGYAEANTLVSRAVHLFSIGGNDYLYPLISNSTALERYSHEEYVKMVIGNLTTVIKEIYRKGGRKFGFVNLEPLGCMPNMKAAIAGGSRGSCMEEEASTLAKLHNVALDKILKKLGSHLGGFKYSVTNFYVLVSELTNHPSKYGFKEGNAACCGSGPYRGAFSCGGRRAVKEYELCEKASDYVYFDSVHYTDRAHQHLAQLMWRGNRNITWPCNLQALFHH